MSSSTGSGSSPGGRTPTRSTGKSSAAVTGRRRLGRSWRRITALLRSAATTAVRATRSQPPPGGPPPQVGRAGPCEKERPMRYRSLIPGMLGDTEFGAGAILELADDMAQPWVEQMLMEPCSDQTVDADVTPPGGVFPTQPVPQTPPADESPPAAPEEPPPAPALPPDPVIEPAPETPTEPPAPKAGK